MRWSVVFSCLLLSGCLGRARFKFDAQTSANNAGSMYLVVRQDSRLEFQRTSYGDIEAAIAIDDPLLLKTVVLYPDERRRVVVKTGGEGVGLYFMFSDPSGTDWKTYCPEPCRGKYNFDVERSRIR